MTAVSCGLSKFSSFSLYLETSRLSLSCSYTCYNRPVQHPPTQKGHPMKRIASALLCISIISSTLLSSCGKSTSKDTTPASDQETVTTDPSTIPSQDVTITPIDFSDPVVSDPGLDWQYDISFPDWQDRSMYGANNRLGFYGYSGQGVIYIQPGAGSGKFSLYINDTRIDTSEMAPGKVYSLDISGITRCLLYSSPEESLILRSHRSSIPC